MPMSNERSQGLKHTLAASAIDNNSYLKSSSVGGFANVLHNLGVGNRNHNIVLCIVKACVAEFLLV